MSLSVMFARFPFLGAEHPDATDWLVKAVLKAKSDPRVGEVLHYRVDDTPITMGRNRAVEVARKHHADVLVMLDSDMSPDLELPGARPFWDTSLDFLLAHRGPCLVAAPYCGPPPVSNVYIFRWANHANDEPDPTMRLEMYGREEAAGLGGIQEVAALPTGLIMIDLRALDSLEPPYFYYEWKDATQSEKASTEDVTFTRDLSLAGVPVYCNWDAWAGHWKRWRVGKPEPLTHDKVRLNIEAAARGKRHSLERLIDVRPEKGVA